MAERVIAASDHAGMGLRAEAVKTARARCMKNLRVEQGTLVHADRNRRLLARWIEPFS